MDGICGQTKIKLRIKEFIANGGVQVLSETTYFASQPWVLANSYSATAAKLTDTCYTLSLNVATLSPKLCRGLQPLATIMISC